MLILGLVLAVLAALLHVFIFYLESLAWTGGRARAIFGTTLEEATATRELAFNQGFYNLFLAVLALLGVGLTVAGSAAVGLTLTLAGTGCMLAAGLVLLVSSPAKASAAVRQLTLPALAVIALVAAILLG